MKQIKVLKINQNNLLGSTVCGITDDSFSKQGTYNFLIKILELYRQKEFEDDEKVTEFIKLTLSDDEDKAHEQWFNGVIWEGRLYKGWFASVGGMKQEDSKSKSKCEAYFVDKNLEGFKNYFETIISLGKFNNLDKEEDRYVNKEILSRFSLATSDLISEIDMPNIIILPTAKLDWKRTYKTVAPKTTTYINEDGEVMEGIDYDLIDYEFDTDKRDENGKQIDKMEAFDGGGIATPKAMDAIGTALKRNDIDFAIIRAYGIGIKGLVTRFDILKYLEIMHNKIGDTDYCYKKEGKFHLLDMYGDFREVTDNTLLLNESMVKLADKFENMDDYYTQLNKVNTDEHRAIYDVLNKLYITKVNKKNEEIDEYRRLNYQFFNVLALTKSEYYELAKEDFRLYKKLLKPYKKGTNHGEFTECLDTINIFYNQCAKKDELDNMNDITNTVDKCNALLMLNKKYVRLSYVKKNLAKDTEKKIREMAAGKITLKASYNYIAVDPVSYMNFAMIRNQGENGLKEGQFYCRNINNGETRTIFRNPCMAYSEVHNIDFIKTDFFDNWLCKSNEIVYFNNKSDILNLIGSADLDGDCVNMVNNEIVKNAVIVPKDNKYFCFTADGKKEKCKFNDEGRFLATYRPSGNLIGQVAIMGVNVNNKSQTVKRYYSPNKNKFFTFPEIKNMYVALDKNLKDTTDDQLKDLIEKTIEDGNLAYTDSLDNEFIRNKIKEQFYENEKDIYNLLYCSSLVIDSPKTMNIIDVDKYTRIVKDKYSQRTGSGKVFKKINFLQYKGSCDDVNSYMYRGVFNSPLDKFGQKVSKELLETIKTRKYSFGDNSEILQNDLSVIEDKYFNEELFDTLTEMCSDYSRRWDMAIKKYRDSRRIELNKIETEFTILADELMKNYDLLTIGKALSKIKNCRERFIICFFFQVLNEVDKLNPSIKNYYELDENGEIDYMYKKYSRLEKAVNLSDSAILNLSIKDKVRLKQLVELRFKSDNLEEVTKKIYQGLEEDGYYDLHINDGIEIFPDFKKALSNREVVRVKYFMKKKDGTDSISKKSFGIVIDR